MAPTRSRRPERAAIYVRLSRKDDQTNTPGLDRQERACRALAERGGYQVVEVVREVGSAWSARSKRPGYDRLMAMVDERTVDVVLAWSSDRLYRRLADLVELTDRLGPVRVETTQGGDIDLATADGRLHANMLGAIGQHYSDRLSERVKAHQAHRAEVEHRLTPSGRRTFGWRWVEPDADNPERPRRGSRAGLVPDETEAPALTAVYRAIAAGASTTSQVKWLNDQGFRTSAGGEFTNASLRSCLLSGRHVGQIIRHGNVIGPADDGLAIIDEPTWWAVRRSYEGRKGAPRRGTSLLSGLVVHQHPDGSLGACRASAREGVPTYRCPECGASRQRSLVEPHVIAAVGAWLRRHGAKVVAAAPARVGGAAADVEALEARLSAMADLAAEGRLSPEAYAAQDQRLRERIAKAKAALEPRPALDGLGSDPAEAWERLADPERQHAVIAELIEHVVLLNRPRRPTEHDLEIAWR
ncbi:MAG: hypothetical protein GC157_04615 [Frankiales bacterium]|nr:hypothetical protein [Frankiales bacterium]